MERNQENVMLHNKNRYKCFFFHAINYSIIYLKILNSEKEEILVSLMKTNINVETN